MRKIWGFHGGVHPPENKIQSNQHSIADVELASEYIIPLNQHIGAPSVVSVQVGDRVLKGQIIAEAQGYVSVAAHAPTSGTVEAIELRPINHPSGLEAMCVVLKPDFEDQWVETSGIENWRDINKTELLSMLAKAGIAGMGGAGFPTAVKMNPRADHPIDTLILNGTECEPYITADDVLMREKAGEIVAGLEIMAHILGMPKNIIIGVEDNKPEAAESMQQAAEKSAMPVEVVTFPTKYPSGGEKQLVQILTGREVPSGKIPADIGTVLQNVGTAHAVYRAIELGEPLISRVTTLVGESLETQRNVNALIGTPIEHLLKLHGFNEAECERIIIGGPMMGYAVPHALAPIVKTTNCVLVPSKTEISTPEPEQPCIRCGVCAEACPASLLPQQLYWFSRSEDFERLRSHNLNDCIECGACSYVCPSNIPLVQYYRASKGAIRHHDEEKRKAEHSRKRFEFRKARIEKAEAEKLAKREARKRAAEAAKAKLAESKADIPASGADRKAVETQLADSKSSHSESAAVVDVAKSKAKLERAYSSANSRVERAVKALIDAKEELLDEARIESLAARLKGAEAKASDAKKRLEEFLQKHKPETTNDDGSSNGDSASTQESAKAESYASASAASINAKLDADAETKLEKTIDTLKKRIETAKQKATEAEADETKTVDALRTGIEKLEAKRVAAETELAELKTMDQSTLPETASAGTHAETIGKTAAQKAIEKAQARAAETANMSDAEKNAAQIESLTKRLEKAQNRLQKAIEADNDNIDAFQTGVDKLQAKLNSLSE